LVLEAVTSLSLMRFRLPGGNNQAGADPLVCAKRVDTPRHSPGNAVVAELVDALA
jgi:hypothetical protein